MCADADPMLIQQARGLNYIGPRKACIASLIAEVFAQMGPMGPGAVARRMWRTRPQRRFLTLRQAAIFCYGRKCTQPDDRWAFAQWPDEDSPIDVVCRRTTPAGAEHFEFVQLKEVVPEELNPDATLQDVLDGVAARYRRADGITVAVNLNQSVTTDLTALRIPALPGATLWLYGLAGEPNLCFLVGDLLSPPAVHYGFPFPRAEPGESPTRWSGLLDE